ncbi:alpha/beta fold hydrolase [Lutimaribacter marinistellae]|uniref:Alpha/beta fold hydrolase n=1 Tax=Lutimaribacter marinistellae TaxID=1820329 RepID=A0ABV7TGC4_9RHOB
MAEFRTTDGLRLHYEDTGEGRPLVCLPGLTRNGRDFDFLRPHVPGYRVITLDYRGRGLSDHDPDHANYNVFRESRDVVELIETLGLGRVTILGTSRGGLLAMALAASHPEMLAGVILNDIGPVVETSGIARIMEYLGRRPDWQSYGEATEGMAQAMAPQFPGVEPSVWQRQVEASYVETPEGLGLRYDPALRQAVLEQAATGAAPDFWMFFERLGAIPTGVIRGANSDVLSRDTVSEMHRRHPGLISAEVPDRGHVPFLDEPEALSIIRQIMETAK